MAYKISGNIAEDGTIIVLADTDYSVVEQTDVVTAGAYEITVSGGGAKTLLARTNSGEVTGYTGVSGVSDTVWVSVFDNTDWRINPSEPYGTWQSPGWRYGSHSGQDGGDYEINITAVGSWATGFRPTKLRFTDNAAFGDRLWVYDTADNLIVNRLFLNPGSMEIDLDFSNNLDIDNIMMRHPIQPTISNIEFFGVPVPEVWTSYFDNTKWAEDFKGTWNGAQNRWDSEDSQLYIVTTGSWHVGYRPSKIRATIQWVTTDPELNIDIFDNCSAWNSLTDPEGLWPFRENLQELVIFDQVSDFCELDFAGSGQEFYVTNIEFLEP